MENEKLNEWVVNSINYSPLWSILSIILFSATKVLLSKVIQSSKEGRVQSQQGPTTSRVTAWKLVNTANSLFHSIVTGIGALICFYLHPRTAADVVSTYSTLSHVLTAFSVGYFIFDFCDMFKNHRKRSSYELMVHHTFVISCFGVSMITRYYLGFVMVALVIEVNSIFLHWRQLLLLTQVPKGSTYYRGVSLLNLFTFVIFRIITLAWMTRWLALNKSKVSLPIYTLGSVAMAVLVCMSIVLFLRLLKSDFHSSSYNSNRYEVVANSKGN